MDDGDRYARQLPLLGQEGQAAIRATRVAIVGLGGLGSHLSQQLAYLGVRDFLLIDGDHVSTSNLNRLIGAVPGDAESARLKIDVARDLITAIAPTAAVETIEGFPTTAPELEVLREVDLVFGAVDNDGSRLSLNAYCQAYDLPYIDTATDVDPDGPGAGYGGRVVVSAGGGGCISCLDLLDQNALDWELASEEGRRQLEKIYGVPVDALGTSGPAVVSVNGVVASLAVTEFMNLVTGLRQPRLHLCYLGSFGVVNMADERQVDSCYYCDGIRGMGDAVAGEILGDGDATSE